MKKILKWLDKKENYEDVWLTFLFALNLILTNFFILVLNGIKPVFKDVWLNILFASLGILLFGTFFILLIYFQIKLRKREFVKKLLAWINTKRE